MAPSAASPRAFINSVNSQYEQLHKTFELQFWGTKMNLNDKDTYNTKALTNAKKQMEDFLADEAKLAQTRQLKRQHQGKLTPEERTTLDIFERTFGCYIMESNDARRLREDATNIEGTLEAARNTMRLGATIDNTFIEMSSVGLRNKMRVDDLEANRRACWEGLRGIGDFVLENGFVDLVKKRNQMAKLLGYQDYYDYKVTQAEGFGKDKLFKILDTLEIGTRPIMERARQRLEASKGALALEPWNMGYMLSGAITRKLDPYFPFESAVERWGRSFGALGIKYENAEMKLDLLDRKGKYSNGFCHWPQPSWIRADGTWQPTVTHFTSLADPSAVGSGLTALTTLMHEAGHAAHFANIRMPSPLFSQERAPTSVAYAELQSMFLDSLVSDASWRARYAISRSGERIPWELLEEEIREKHPYEVFALRAMLAVSYFEKGLYEMSQEEMTSKSISALADEVEKRIQGGLSARPLLSVPHLVSDEASCYYHGYTLAEMGVHQTRAFFLKHGEIVDNPKVGPTLRDAYWRPGNSRPFLELVEGLTGKPLSGQDWVSSLEKDVETLLAEEKVAYDAAIACVSSAQEEEPNLDMKIQVVDGDEILADSEADGGFLAACRRFQAQIQSRFPAPGA